MPRNRFVWNESADDDRIDNKLVKSEVEALLDDKLKAGEKQIVNFARRRAVVYGKLSSGFDVAVEFVEQVDGRVQIQRVEVNREPA